MSGKQRSFLGYFRVWPLGSLGPDSRFQIACKVQGLFEGFLGVVVVVAG